MWLTPTRSSNRSVKYCLGTLCKINIEIPRCNKLRALFFGQKCLSVSADNFDCSTDERKGWGAKTKFFRTGTNAPMHFGDGERPYPMSIPAHHEQCTDDQGTHHYTSAMPKGSRAKFSMPGTRTPLKIIRKSIKKLYKFTK